LTMTRGLGWLETILGIVTMVLLIGAAAAIATENTNVAIAIEAILAALALIYRGMAKARWVGLDWMICRDSSPARGAL